MDPFMQKKTLRERYDVIITRMNVGINILAKLLNFVLRTYQMHTPNFPGAIISIFYFAKHLGLSIRSQCKIGPMDFVDFFIMLYNVNVENFIIIGKFWKKLFSIAIS